MKPPAIPTETHRDSQLGGGSSVPAFVSQSGSLTNPSIPDCRAGSMQRDACPPIQLLEGSHSTSAGASNPPAGPCNLITRFDGWEAIVPLMFIPLEEPHD